ncbi:MAG: hypothetical protein K9J16_17885 [Melioribacteraceae bacterium]|nr:hypothetical protein [Melioribacteraceae bacterium]MCF8356634.1 hypothetical protein [Melioribacteraceae bacterium]MCF8396012.1 hypothetical protein [Melioribacteraceae bacterium]MCF8421043.1 hypothetical protein [Melioribacteraceae bacterium]
MNTRSYLSCVIFFSIPLIFSCSDISNVEIDRFQFPNTLDIKNIPAGTEDWNSFAFFDKGSWFGFALPQDSANSYYGSFPGPFMLDSQKWLSDKLIQFRLWDESGKNEYLLSGSDYLENNYYPGLLRQKQLVGGNFVTSDLFYLNSSTAIFRFTIQNVTNYPARFKLGWSGRVTDSMYRFNNLENNLLIESDSGDRAFTVSLPADLFLNVWFGKNNRSYRITSENIIEIPSASSYSTYIIISSDTAMTPISPAEIEKEFELNSSRWNNYLNRIFANGSPHLQSKLNRRLAAKCLNTLMNNWRAPLDDLKHDGLFPSYAVWYFNGFWAWDSWKHAAALALFDPELAENQIRAMFDFQSKNEMIADVIYSDSTENNWRNSKPPLAAWAAEQVFTQNNDTSFISEMYPKLISYHQWWYENRDHDNNGLCEYGSTDATLTAAKWESGMDDAVRFDNSKLLQNSETAWSIDQESVDLNSFLYKEKITLAEFAGILNKPKESEALLNQAAELKSKINRLFFDEEAGYYFDRKINSGEFIKTFGSEGWIPLWSGAADPGKAGMVRKNIMDTSKFNTFLPFPTVSRDDSEFNTGYWRGPVWIDQVYFGITGLKNFGFEEEAKILTEKLLKNANGFLNLGAPIRENYDPITGKGLRVNHFSWSATHILMLLTEE